MQLLETMIEQIFSKQVRYCEGRYTISSPFSAPERMQWMGSGHCAMLARGLYGRFGMDYYLEDYACGKRYGHFFCPAIGQFTKAEKLIAPMLALMVKRFGWGRIEPVVTDYGKGSYRFDFFDSPIARGVYRLYGKQPRPVDSMMGGLLAGSAEHLTRRKLAAVETKCLAAGDSCCSFTMLPPAAAARELLPSLKGGFRTHAEAVVKLDAKSDFLKEAEALRKAQNRAADISESLYLKGLGR